MASAASPQCGDGWQLAPAFVLHPGIKLLFDKQREDAHAAVCLQQLIFASEGLGFGVGRGGGKGREKGKEKESISVFQE